MSALRLTARAAVLLRTPTPVAPALTRTYTSARASTPASSPVNPHQPKSESLAESLSVQHGYASPVDHGTSEASPPTSLPPNHPEGGTLSAATISGAPVDLQARTVRIYKKSKPATQSSNFPGEVWTMDWDTLGKGGRWENPLMGWASSSDFMQGTALKFKSKEDAIRFAEKQGYEYFVQEPNVRAFRPKAYAANFTHSPGKLKIVRTK